MPEQRLLVWRLRSIMHQREIDTVRELQRRLAQAGYSISEVQLGRIRKSLPRLLDTRLLDALCTVLDVPPGQLLMRQGEAVFALAQANALPGARQKVPDAVPTSTPTTKPAIPEQFPIAGPKIGAMRAQDDE